MTPTDRRDPADPAVLRRGEVIRINVGKNRPFVIVSSDVVNQSIGTVIVVPLTTIKPNQTAKPHEVTIRKTAENGLSDDSFAQAQYVTMVDLMSRVTGIVGKLNDTNMVQITNQLMLVLGHIPTRGSDKK